MSLLPLPSCNGGSLCVAARTADGASRQVRDEVSANAFTGTYHELVSQDAEIGRKVLAATAHLDEGERVKQGRALLRILRAAPLFSIEQYGTTFLMNYPDGARVPYEADGKPRAFRATGGEAVTVRADIDGTRLTVDLTWSGGERLRLSYDRKGGTDKLVFTRTAGNHDLSAPITVESVFERVSPKATRTFKQSLAAGK